MDVAPDIALGDPLIATTLSFSFNLPFSKIILIAKRIVELRMSLSGERFANLKQLENIPRVNWDQFIEEDIIFIS